MNKKFKVVVNYVPGGNERFLLGQVPSTTVLYFASWEEASLYATRETWTAPSGAWAHGIITEVTEEGSEEQIPALTPRPVRRAGTCVDCGWRFDAGDDRRDCECYDVWRRED